MQIKITATPVLPFRHAEQIAKHYEAIKKLMGSEKQTTRTGEATITHTENSVVEICLTTPESISLPQTTNEMPFTYLDEERFLSLLQNRFAPLCGAYSSAIFKTQPEKLAFAEKLKNIENYLAQARQKLSATPEIPQRDPTQSYLHVLPDHEQSMIHDDKMTPARCDSVSSSMYETMHEEGAEEMEESLCTPLEKIAGRLVLQSSDSIASHTTDASTPGIDRAKGSAFGWELDASQKFKSVLCDVIQLGSDEEAEWELV